MAGGKKSPMTEETLINKLPFSVVKSLSLRLDIDRQWERLVTKIPKRLSDVGNTDPNCEMRYSHLQIRLFEDKGRRPDGSPTNTIINDWATQNTKVKHLLRVLQEAALYEAADYISEGVLHQGQVARLPSRPSSGQESLPQPQWPEQSNKISSTNFDEKVEKQIYQREKEINCDSPKYTNFSSVPSSQPNGTYNSLTSQRRDGNEYLDCRGIIYEREPSFTSGDVGSVLLQGGNMPSAGDHVPSTSDHVAMEHEETHDIYTKAKPIVDEVYSYATQPVREPCESDDSPPSSSKTDIYKHIGPQKKINYNMLKVITSDFDRKPISEGGRVIGSGGFGEVFLGVFDNGNKVAVKKLKNVDEVDKQFQTELESLIKYRHKNIVCLYAYSIDGPGKCLVYEYLPNGSLEDRLMLRDRTPPLSVQVRLSILHGTAEGISFLNSQGIVHRDIKSANVLLDENFEPKVGDFATARTGPRGNATMAMSTSVVIGTSAYLAPEATRFDVSTKLDSYSFGVIIFEMLTALPPLDHNREEKDLKSHVEESEIQEILDLSGGKWANDTVDALLKLADNCTKMKKKQRCNVVDILPDLASLC